MIAARPDGAAASADVIAERASCVTVLERLRDRLSMLAGPVDGSGQSDGLVEAHALRIECQRIDAAIDGIGQGLHRSDAIDALAPVLPEEMED